MWQRIKRAVKQSLLWVAEKLCEVIVWIVDGVQAVVETGKEVAEVAAGLAVKIVQRVRATKVVRRISEFIKTVWEGVKAVKEFIDVPETLHTIWLVVLWLWTFAMGLACSSHVAAPWASAALCATGVMYFALLVATSLFALFLLGMLSRPYRS
jgi:hypothetical protein